MGTIFPLTINICDRGRTITHLQISRFHTQVWYNYIHSIVFTIWTGHDNDTTLLRANFQIGSITDTDALEKNDI